MKGMQGCKFFRCDSCGKLKSIKQMSIEKVAYTKFDRESFEKLIFEVHHTMMCNDCKNPKKKKG